MATKKAAKKAAKPGAQKLPKSRKVNAPKNKNSLSFTQGEFLEHLKGFCGLPKRTEARELWDDIASFLTMGLQKGYKIPLAGLGKLYVRRTKARMGRNPATGEPISIPPKKRIRFTAAKALKQAVLN